MSKRFEIFAKVFGAGVPEGAPAVAYSSLTGSAAAFAAATLAVKSGRVVLAVTVGLPEADTLSADLETMADEVGVRVLEFPPSIEDDRSTVAARLKVSAALGAYAIRPYPLVIVAPVMALREGVAASERVRNAEISLSTEGADAAAVGFSALQTRLLAAGYERVVEVSSPGEFSVRGGVLDVWSPDAESPVRAEFFGDEIESLRVFDAATQISVRKIHSTVLSPVSLTPQPETQSAAPEAQNSEPGTRNSQLTTHNSKLTTLFSLLPPESTILQLDYGDYAGEMAGLLADDSKPSKFRMVFTGDPAPREVPTCPFMTSPLPGFAEQRVTDAVLVDRVR